MYFIFKLPHANQFKILFFVVVDILMSYQCCKPINMNIIYFSIEKLPKITFFH